MSQLDIPRARDGLQAFEFKRVFIEELGWSLPTGIRDERLSCNGEPFRFVPIAQLAGVVVYEATCPAGIIPDARARLALDRELTRHKAEHLTVYIDAARTQSLWYWVKREEGRQHPREHYFVKGQPGDLFLGKLAGLMVDLSEFDATGQTPLAGVLRRLKDALDIERTTRRFYADFASERLAFTDLIRGIRDERDRRWYATTLLNRMMFIYFLQKKFMLDGGNDHYLRDRLTAARARGKDRYYAEFLQALFFDGFARPKADRSAETRALIGDIPYLNGGLFVQHAVERRYAGRINIPDQAFDNLLTLFERYTWHLDDTPGGKDDELNPDVLGYIFEKYINQKEYGAYYTRPEITEYLCEQTIQSIIVNGVNAERQRAAAAGLAAEAAPFESLDALLMGLDAGLCQRLINDNDGLLAQLSLLDPSCGSGAFLVAAMKTLINVYTGVIGWIERSGDAWARQWLARVDALHRNRLYFVKKQIITRNLYGVDIMREATEIAKLRLFLALVASARDATELEPLPNIDFNLLAGNSLIGLLRVDEVAFDRRQGGNTQLSLGLSSTSKSYAQVLAEKDRLIDRYRNHPLDRGALESVKAEIEQHREGAQEILNALLLEQMQTARVMFEQASWDEKANALGKPKKRPLKRSDVEALAPFHWGYEFDAVMARGGFDAIITNPPWEIHKPQAKEFFAEHSEFVTKNKMTIKEFEKEQGKLLRDPEVRAAWLAYLDRFPHVSAWYRAAPQFEHQSSLVNGKKTGSDVNLYKLFTEQCFNLLRAGGLCGIVIPSGIYTDLGAKGLRELLFEQTRVSGLFGFENRKAVFEGVHRGIKFVVLSFEKGGRTETFPAAFMRHEVADLIGFPRLGALPISVDLVRRLSPDSLSVMEFKSELDVAIAQKMLRFPLLGEKVEGTWNLRLTREFDMTNDSHLFKTEPGKGRLPLYEGKMIHQFDAFFAEPRYWVDEKEGRRALLG
ncbi:MAG: hypothetical protein K1X39_13830, partial [Thermoflexales bacterium]|nr:hypothetical protein [Thermoflexales bacterium]